MVDANEKAHLYASGRVKLGGLFITLVSLAVQLDKKLSLLDEWNGIESVANI